ncbi:hypothetical protein NDU88_004137 [Pleurodeles waltl]|uniref:Uncharacterized protein n=1 Tax=Pleurodeles waltl TaxID=8319 RepID=A0AAV7MAT6_PLEWA|nr:hypothetical protein NDU88_004137 [Pleurodeles waltl]
MANHDVRRIEAHRTIDHDGLRIRSRALVFTGGATDARTSGEKILPSRASDETWCECRAGKIGARGPERIRRGPESVRRRWRPLADVGQERSRDAVQRERRHPGQERGHAKRQPRSARGAAGAPGWH